MKLKTGEKGFTLVELLVALSIAAFVTAAASMTIITMMRLTPKTNNWAIALRQVQDAGYWISRDVLMSQTILVDPDPGTPTFLTLTVPQPPPALAKTIVYQFQDMSGGLKRLMRTDNTTIMVAEYISSGNTTATYDDVTLILTLKVTATSGDTTVTRQYEATQRVPAASP
jgi:prepilin-type N-terminal cleavage/methylation domain-containing protein